MENQIIQINLVPNMSTPAVVRVSQYDVGRPLVFKVYDGTSPADLTGVTAVIEGTKRSGLGFSESGTVSDNTVTLDTTIAMTQEDGSIPAEIRFSKTGEDVGTANFILAVEPSPHLEGTTDGTTETMADLQSQLDALDERVEAIEEGGGGGGLTEAVKSAMLQIAQKVAYIDEHGQTYYNALYNALYSSARLVRITAVYTQSGTVYDTYVLDSLNPDLVVTAQYDDGTSATVVGYALSGTLEEGTSTITVSYSGKTTTFNVAVSARIPSEYKQIEYLESDGTQGIATDIIPRDTETIVTFEFTGYRASADNFVTGVYNANNQRYYACWLNNSGKLMFYNRSNALKWTGPTNPTGKHTVDFNNASHQAIYDGEVKATDSTFALTAEDNKVAIFCRGRDTTEAYLATTSIVRIYNLKYVDNTTGDAIGEFIPCYRKSDNVGGMYDLVSETFYTDAISGNPFTLGSGAWETGA